MPEEEAEMHCDHCQEIVSARLDGESTTLEDDAADQHLARCGPCARYEADLHRLPVAPRVELPLDGLAPLERVNRLFDRMAWSPGSEAPGWARYGLLVIALTEVILALPELVLRGHGLSIHDQHHLGAWELAFGIGLVVVAWQPERARGLLPMAAALGFAMAVTALVDVVDHTIPLADEAHHAFDFAGVYLLWVIGRSFRLRPSRWRARHEMSATTAPGPATSAVVAIRADRAPADVTAQGRSA